MFHFFKQKISILDDKWNLIDTFKVKSIPRMDELIYLKSTNTYHQIIAVIHCLEDKNGIFIVVKTYAGSVPNNIS